MKIAFTTICINPSFPIKQSGFIQQVKPIYNFHDDLHARILAIDDGDKIIYHISVDSLGFPIMLQDSLKEILVRKYNRTIEVIISATHTHFAGDNKDVRYIGEVSKKLLYAIDYLEFVESDEFRIAYQCIPFTKVGTSRISNHNADVLLQLFTIYNGEIPFISMIVHNCHPTILHGDTPYFSSEYPGYVISELKKRMPNTNFTFIQGAAGDVSSRFTRPSQDYQAVMDLGNKLVNEIERLMDEEKEIVDFDKVNYDFSILPLIHEFNPIDLSQIPDNLSDREKETIATGVRVREILAENLHTLDHQVMISKLDFGKYTIVFCPNEAFSSYIDSIDISKAALGCYSNGYSPYITGINDNFITYEKFTDTYTVDTKVKYMEILRKYGK